MMHLDPHEYPLGRGHVLILTSSSCCCAHEVGGPDCSWRGRTARRIAACASRVETALRISKRDAMRQRDYRSEFGSLGRRRASDHYWLLQRRPKAATAADLVEAAWVAGRPSLQELLAADV
jgi:hypothetical protein